MTPKPKLVHTTSKAAGPRKAKPVTVAQIGAVSFSAIPELAAQTQATRITCAHNLARQVRTAAVIAAEIVAMDKPNLVARVGEETETFAHILIKLTDAVATARALVEIMHAAELRVSSALVVVTGAAERGTL
jgi:hypothetical protein